MAAFNQDTAVRQMKLEQLVVLVVVPQKKYASIIPECPGQCDLDRVVWKADKVVHPKSCYNAIAARTRLPVATGQSPPIATWIKHEWMSKIAMSGPNTAISECHDTEPVRCSA